MVYSNTASEQAQVPGSTNRRECSGICTAPYNANKMNDEKCVIVSNTVTGICPDQQQCRMGVMIVCIPQPHLTISGTVTENWSRTTWQNVVNTAVRMLAAGPFGSHFISASATVN
ncbi:hypothetical protein KIN20_030319 [Parelaphostrongylus tenuis]|uniref:Uncharacterized protein n=1 Tax=Parelaphostrongylus tenuis TaxID=148309 RepID=A0AAD5R3J6_PARTN|nr:hypothetical protein KIN20_030319 [Parelaphostrongylus tenuis]